MLLLYVLSHILLGFFILLDHFLLRLLVNLLIELLVHHVFLLRHILYVLYLIIYVHYSLVYLVSDGLILVIFRVLSNLLLHLLGFLNWYFVLAALHILKVLDWFYFYFSQLNSYFSLSQSLFLNIFCRDLLSPFETIENVFENVVFWTDNCDGVLLAVYNDMNYLWGLFAVFYQFHN